MNLVGIDVSGRQLSKLRNGHKVRVKHGSGFNLVVHPENYHLVHRAFTKGKATDIKLTPEEIEDNASLSPEAHAELKDASPMAAIEGGSIFGKLKKASKSKHGKMAKRMAYEMAADKAHEGIAKAHAKASEYTGGNEYAQGMLNEYANKATSHIEKNRAPIEQRGGSVYKQIKKGLTGKTAKSIYKHTKPLRQAAYEMASEKLNDYISQGQNNAMNMAGDNPNMQGMVQHYGNQARNHVERNRAPPADRYMYGHGLGAGVGGMNAHDALRLASLANAQANHKLAQMHNASVHGQMTQPPIKHYWDDPMEPRSRGTGMRGHNMNFIRGRGSLLGGDEGALPPALRSQPYGANFQFQHFLPPEYSRYSNGGSMEGNGLYL